VPSQGWIQRLIHGLLAIGVAGWCCTPVIGQEVMRLKYDVAGDSKPIILHATEITTWTNGSQRMVLLKGKALLEHGVVQARMQQAVVWIDQQDYRKTGILRVEVYAEGEVTLENGTETRTGPQALLQVSTRGELKLKSQGGKVNQQPRADDPLYRRGLEVRSANSRAATSNAVQQVSFESPAAAVPMAAVTSGVDTVPRPESPSNSPVPALGTPLASPVPSISASAPAAGTEPTHALDLPVAPPDPSAQPEASTALPGSINPVPRQAPIGAQPSAGAPLTPGSTPTGPRSLATTPIRQFSILPRTSAGFAEQTFQLESGETAIVVTGGVILVVRTSDNQGLLDIEADRLVLWTRGNPKEMLSNLRRQEGQSSRELEFYLSGNVEIRSRTGTESRTLRADEVYYDVGRNVAVAMHADLELLPNPAPATPGKLRLPDPIHLKAEELQQLSQNLFKGMKAEVFSSRLPSDPGLKVYVEEATVEEKAIPKRSIFGRPVVDRRTGLQETEHQQLFDGSNVLVKLENVPVLYLPCLRGDINDPLGPLESVTFNINRVFGTQIGASFNVYDLLGVDPLPSTRWRFDVDYLSQRGPAAGTNFDYATTHFFDAPARVAGQVRSNIIYDTGEDILGGPRTGAPHTDWRGRFFWRQNVQELPDGFSLQTQISWLSDKNYLEQFFKNEFDNDLNQETFVYLKQQRDNWAWTILTEPHIRNWVTETEWLPRADGYLLGQSFFNRFTYNAQASAAYARLEPTDIAPGPVQSTDLQVNTGRFDLRQELSLPFTFGPMRVVPYGVLDLTYYVEDLMGNESGRAYGGGGVRGSIPFTRLYPDIQSDLLNLNGINHKIVVSGNYYIAQTDTPFNTLPQLDRLNDDATDQALRDITPLQPQLNPQHGLALQKSPLFDPQTYAIRRLVEDRIDTLGSIEVIQADIRQRWQTKRGYPGQQHIVDWMTLDLSVSFFPLSKRDNFGEVFSFLEYDWTWNIGDRTSLVSSGWYDPQPNGARVFNIGANINHADLPDRTNFYLGYRDIETLNSQAVIAAVTYVFSPKYAMTANATYDFGIGSQVTSLVLTRMGSDLQVSFGISYNSYTSNFGVTFEIVPNLVPPNRRIPVLAGLGPALPR
jgi:hypothetical protein